MRDVKRHLISQGVYGGGKRPLGFDVVNHRLVPNANEQAAVARMQALRANGRPLREISKGARIGVTLLKWRRPALSGFFAPLRRDDGGINAGSVQWAAWRITFASFLSDLRRDATHNQSMCTRSRFQCLAPVRHSFMRAALSPSQGGLPQRSDARCA
jgi:hypothetical protein